MKLKNNHNKHKNQKKSGSDINAGQWNQSQIENNSDTNTI